MCGCVWVCVGVCGGGCVGVCVCMCVGGCGGVGVCVCVWVLVCVCVCGGEDSITTKNLLFSINMTSPQVNVLTPPCQPTAAVANIYTIFNL